ncbi:restriction endonuclease subunit S, partial [Flavihumibacter sediminis]|nr:restriction endonuclease subunit S [Flavihumibacter sediminis]
PIEIAKKYYLKQFDILVNEGGDFDKVGRCAIWGASIQPCIHQNHIFAVRIDGVNQQYFEYAINSDSSRDYFLGTYKKSTNLASLNKTNLNLLPVPLPPLNEQNRIVEKLSELMNLCDDLQQSIQ